MNNWNNISSNVSLRRVNSDRNVGTFVFVRDTDRSGLYWETLPYTRNWDWIAEPNNRPWSEGMLWARTDVIIYENQMNEDGMNRAQKISNATHEFWHSLKLAHPSFLWFWQSSVMKQWIQDIGPEEYDRSELQSNWWQ